MAITVDIHCHTFNADDIPLGGFMREVFAEWPGLFWTLLDRFAQSWTPGYGEELAVLDRLLAQALDEGGFQPSAAEDEPSALAAISARAEELRLEMEGEDDGELAAATPMLDLDFNKWRRVAAVAMGSRLTSTRALQESNPAGDLFVPSLVDLEYGAEDWAETSVRDQVAMHEKISRLSMLGRLRAPVHPFVGFDPRRQVQSSKAGDIVSAFDVVKDAVRRYGFIGVKVYPPMGWRPFGNEENPPERMTTADGRLCDEVLAALYDWCIEEHVPITAHSNPSNFADQDYKDFSSPASWKKVFTFEQGRWAGLHVNFGHFGGIQKTDKGVNGWPQEFAKLAEEFPVYADVSNHSLGDRRAMAEYLALLVELFNNPETAAMKDRLMLGSDWWMMEGFEERFLGRYIDMYTEIVTNADVDRFRGGAALEFLGFAGVDVKDMKSRDNQNRIRLAKRYEQYDLGVPAWLQGTA